MGLKIKRIWWVGAVVLLVYTRLIGTTWGLPYPFHPDERNIAVAVSLISPENYFQPGFFAYGQLTIYLAYLLGIIANFLNKLPLLSISVEGATLLLRIIAASCAVATFFVSFRIIRIFFNKLSSFEEISASLLLIFSPAIIQLAHFGTTESILMLFYTLLVYFSLKIANEEDIKRKNYHLLLSGIYVGLAAGAKISSLLFIFLPLTSYIVFTKKRPLRKFLTSLFKIFIFFAVIAAVLFISSPYNFLEWEKFRSSLQYEAEVAQGLPVFYTRSFLYSVPVIFQFTKIFPYALGFGVTAFFIAGFFLLPNKKNYNILRFSFLLYFMPSTFLFAKWTRFMAPILPIMIIFVCIFITRIFERVQLKILYFIIVLICVAPGLAYLSIYQNSDVRFKASDWIYKNIPEGSYILSETANVVDLPISPPNNHFPITNNYHYISFDFYNVDENPLLQTQLDDHIKKADYIFVLSRRVYANHTCLNSSQLSVVSSQLGYEKDRCKKLQEKYPILNEYYRKLFSGELGFKKVTEFTSFPQLCMFNVGCLMFDDEFAEETWTVFDHPVIRIYKKSKF